ncbi:MAG: FAD-binding oxidoreductase [Candidatus Obscuribacterales bacterium]
MTVPVWLDNRTQQGDLSKPAIKADIAIIGGGVVGAACAYLASRRNLKVVVLEAGTVASGASGRNGGFVLRGIHTHYNSCVAQYGREISRYVYGLGERNQALIKDFVETNNVDIDYDPSGSHLLACSLEELEELSRSCQLMHQDGFKVDLIGQDPLDRGFYGALFNSCDFGINPVKFVRALLSISGAQVLEQESVRLIESSGAGITVTASSQSVICDRVIVATNAYSPGFDSFFLDKIQPARGQMLATAPLKKKILNSLCYANYGWEYFRQLPDRRLVVGGCRQSFLEEETGYADLVTKPVQTALEHYLKDHFPELAGIAIEYRWSGPMAFTHDGLPLVGALPHLPSVHFAVGCNGHGLGYSMTLAERVLAVALDNEPPGYFDVARPTIAKAIQNVNDQNLKNNGKANNNKPNGKTRVTATHNKIVAARMTGEFEIGP